MRRRDFLIGLAIVSAARPATAQSKSAHIIGILYLGTETDATTVSAALRRGLMERGYAEESDFRFEIRFANNDPSQLKALAGDLLTHGALVIVTNGTTSARAALAATERVPIVLAGSADPVEQGFVESLARPGGNVTGLSVLGTELLAKRLQLLRDVLPDVRVAGALLHAANPGVAVFRRSLEEAAVSLRLDLRVIEVRRPDEIEPAFVRFGVLGAKALFVIEDPTFVAMADLLVRLSIKHRLPIVTGLRPLALAGGFVSYGFDRLELWYRAADFVDRILKGGMPAEMPIEQPTKFDLVINLKTAKTLGLKIPESIVLQASEVIE